MNQALDDKETNRILRSKNLRKRLAVADPFWFCLIYLRHHFSHPFAPFHLELFHLLGKTDDIMIAVMAFRGSGKSTILNMANVLWSILGKPQKKFAIIVGQTQEQAKNHFFNIKNELKNNELLRSDFGPYTENETDWKNMSLELEYHGSKIQSVSLEQSIRGIRYGMIRPDLIVCDDIEDISTARETIHRDASWQRLTSEILPLGNNGTKIVILGNLVCPDSLLMRIKEKIDEKVLVGIFRAYPLLDDERRIMWPEKFLDLESVQKMKQQFTRGVWTREFLLKILGWSRGMDDDDSHPNLHDEQYSRFGIEDVSYQTPLIPQMDPFVISVPIETSRTHFTPSDDAAYRRYYGNVDIESPIRSVEKEIFVTNYWAKWLNKKLKEEHMNRTPMSKSLLEEIVASEEFSLMVAEAERTYEEKKVKDKM